MKTWFSIANMISLICLILTVIFLEQNISIYETQYNEYRLIKTSEYAAEAAFIESVSVSDNVSDYSTLDTVLLTSDTLRTFCSMIELSYDMIQCPSNDAAVEDSIAVMCLACPDGYYITDTTEVQDHQYKLMWSPKLPYSANLKRANSSDVDTLAVTLSSEAWTLISGASHNAFRSTSGKSYSDSGIYGRQWINPQSGLGETVSLTRAFADTIVSSALTNAIAYRLSDQQFSGKISTEEYSLYLPSIDTYSGINQVHSPSLIVVMANADYSRYKGSCSTMQGLKVVWKTRVIGYINTDGEKMYCYEGQTAYIPDIASIQTSFGSAEEAAKAGYKPNIYAITQTVAGSDT